VPLDKIKAVIGEGANG